MGQLARSPLFAAFVLSLAVYAPVTAEVPFVDVAPTPDEAKALGALKSLPRDATMQDRLNAIDAVLPGLVQPTPTRGALLCVKGIVLAELKRPDDARQAIEQCRQLRPGDPGPIHALYSLAVGEGAVADQGRYMIALVEAARSDQADIDTSTMQSLDRSLHYAQEFDLARSLRNALVRNGWYREDPLYFSSLTASVIRDRVEAGEVDNAVALLPQVTSPEAGVTMLSDRRYAPIWPQIERWAGDDMRTQRDTTVRAAKAAYEQAHSPRTRLAYLDALSETGQRDEAIAALRTWLAETPEADGGYERSLAAIRLAATLAQQKRQDEAIGALSGELPKLDAEWQWNVVPNLAVHLLLAGRNAEVASLLDKFVPAETSLESPAANGYFSALKACALERLGKNALARQAAELVVTRYRTNTGATAILDSCRNDDAALAASWINSTSDPETMGPAIARYQNARYRKAHALPARSLEEAALTRVIDRPEVVARFGEIARPLPSRFELALNEFVAVD